MSEKEARYLEFFSSQTKIFSFLSFFLKGSSALIKPHENCIVGIIRSLFSRCPPDAFMVRRDIVISTQKMVQCDYLKKNFALANVDDLIDGRSFFGPVWYEPLREQGLQLLIELVNIVRDNLNIDQLSRVAIVMCRNISTDSLLSLSMQCASLRLILNLTR